MGKRYQNVLDFGQQNRNVISVRVSPAFYQKAISKSQEKTETLKIAP
jgi:hypothetical protein